MSLVGIIFEVFNWKSFTVILRIWEKNSPDFSDFSIIWLAI